MSLDAELTSSPSDSAEPKRNASLTKLDLAILSVTILIGALMRIWCLSGMPEINGDECWLSSQAYAAGHGMSYTWMEPNDHLADPLFMVPLVVLHWIFAPNILLARGVSVVGGLLALPINFWLCRRAYGSATALVTTLLLAAFPPAIAYSRLGWETIQLMPACLALLYCSILMNTEPERRLYWTTWTLVCSAIAFMVYPVCATIAPLIAGLMLWSVWPDVRRLSNSMRGLSLLAGVSAVLLIVAFVGFNSVRRIWPMAVEPITQPEQSLWMTIGAGRFMSGLAISRYFTGELITRPLVFGGVAQKFGIVEIGFTILLFACGLRLLWPLTAKDRAIDRLLVVGIALSIFFTFILAGLPPVGIPYNRMFLPISAVILVMMARAIVAVPGTRGPLIVCCLFCAYYFGWMGFTYFAPVARAVARSGQPVADLDPTVQILRHIETDSAGRDIFIVSKDYFGYEPLHYLALDNHHIRAYYAQDFGKLGSTAGTAIDSGSLYWVTVGDPKRRLLEAQLTQLHNSYIEYTPKDFEGHNGNTVFHILPRINH